MLFRKYVLFVIAVVMIIYSHCLARVSDPDLTMEVAQTDASRPWLQTFTPRRQLYVSVDGNGNGSSQATPMKLTEAINNAKPGDLFWLLKGTYSGAFTFRNKGTLTNPIVFRALPGHHVVIHGGFQIESANTWIWGLDFTDPSGSAGINAIKMLAPGVHAINNVIHRQRKGGIDAWNAGPGQVVYGNIVYDNGPAHNIYTQNDFSKFGYKYIVNNMFLDSQNICRTCFNVHAYTQQGFISGFHMERNIIRNGRFLIGGYNEPVDNEVIIENHFHTSQAQFGYARPSQVKFKNNFLVQTTLSIGWFWGVGETKYKQTAPNVFTGNQIILPGKPHVDFRTSAYLASGKCEGCTRIRPVDIFNDNTYSSPFVAHFFANNTRLSHINFAQWKNATAAAGNAFDVNSSIVKPPKGSKVVLFPNDYDPKRVHLAVYNWSKLPTVAVDLSPVLSNGESFEIYKVKAIFGAPVKTGNYTGSVTLPTEDDLSLFLILRK